MPQRISKSASRNARELVLDDLDLAVAADRLLAALDRLLVPDVEPDRAIVGLIR
jgi:hypothetical protein